MRSCTKANRTGDKKAYDDPKSQKHQAGQLTLLLPLDSKPRSEKGVKVAALDQSSPPKTFNQVPLPKRDLRGFLIQSFKRKELEPDKNGLSYTQLK